VRAWRRPPAREPSAAHGGGVFVPIDDRDRVESVSALPRRLPAALP
jgi:hypothetical protein